MAEAPEDTGDTQPRSWWEATPVGAPVLLGFVEVERADASLSGDEPLDPERLRQRARYTAGIEFVARSLDAAQPLHWRGERVRLFLQGDARMPAALRALRAAEAIRERALVDLSLPVRIAVHAAVIPWNPDTVALTHPALQRLEHLARSTPAEGLTVTEDVYLALPETEQRRFALLGVTGPERLAAYVFPRNLATREDNGLFQPDAELKLWEAFRRYAGSPEVRRLRYVGFPLQKKQPPSLDIREVFVAPDAQARTPRAVPLMPAVSRLLEGTGLSQQHFEPPVHSEPITRLVSQRRALVVLGDPGSGKTTVLRWLAVVAAAGPLSWAEQLGSAERLLPLLVSVGRLAELRERLGPVGSVIDTLAVYFHDRNVGAKEELRGFLERVLESGECLVLLDGLDEVRGEVRGALLSWLETFCARFPGNRFVASARVVGHAGFSLPEGVETILASFNEEQVRRYAGAFERACRRWENEGLADDVGADRESGKLLEALFKNSRLKDLARNPFLLSALVLIHRAEGQLPRHRVQAYEIFSRTLCETWSNARRVVAGESEARSIRYEEEAVPILGELALRMHQEWPTGVAPEAFVIETLAEAIHARDGGSRPEAKRAASAFLERAGRDVQILLERGAGQWGFLHLTFQEFFTAVGLLSSERFEEVAFEHLFDPRWEEVLRLGVGYMALIQKRAQATQRFIRRVLNHQDEGEDLYLTGVLSKQVYLSALLASEAGDTLPLPLQQEIARAVADWVQRMPDDIASTLLEELSLTDFKERVLDIMVELLERQSEWTRGRAVFALGHLKGERAQQALGALVQDPSLLVRSTLSQSLRTLGTPPSMDMLAALAQDADPNIYLRALLFLISSDSPRAREWVSRFARDAESNILGAFLVALFVSVLLERLEGKKSSDLIDDPSLRTLMKRSLAHPDEDVRTLAFQTAFVLKSEDILNFSQTTGTPLSAGQKQLLGLLTPSLEVPEQTLESEDENIRAMAAYKLALSGNEHGISELLNLLRTGSPETRKGVINMLGFIKAERVQSALFEVARDKDPQVRVFALAAIGKLKLKGHDDEVLQHLEDPELEVRESAILALGLMGSRTSLELLVRIALAAPSLNESRAALQSLWMLSLTPS
ncbi:MAG: HEAT repeat domain-containing protein [Cystobacter sp.]